MFLIDKFLFPVFADDRYGIRAPFIKILLEVCLSEAQANKNIVFEKKMPEYIPFKFFLQVIEKLSYFRGMDAFILGFVQNKFYKLRIVYGHSGGYKSLNYNF
jgi:hypothetical protein